MLCLPNLDPAGLYIHHLFNKFAHRTGNTLFLSLNKIHSMSDTHSSMSMSLSRQLMTQFNYLVLASHLSPMGTHPCSHCFRDPVSLLPTTVFPVHQFQDFGTPAHHQVFSWTPNSQFSTELLLPCWASCSICDWALFWPRSVNLI